MNYRRAVVRCNEGVVHSSRPPGYNVCFADYLHIDEIKPLSFNIIKVSLWCCFSFSLCGCSSSYLEIQHEMPVWSWLVADLCKETECCLGQREVMASNTAGMILLIEGWNAWSISNLMLECDGGPNPRVVGTGKCTWFAFKRKNMEPLTLSRNRWHL